MKFIVNVEKAASKWLTSSVNNVRNEDCKPSMFAATVTSSVLRCRTEQGDAMRCLWTCTLFKQNEIVAA